MNQVSDKSEKALEKRLGDVCIDRAYVYHLLAVAVQPPTSELAENLSKGTFYSEIEKSVRWINEREGMYHSSLERLKKVSGNEGTSNPEELFKQMEEEYKRLFTASSQNYISPHEADFVNKPRDSVVASLLKAYKEEEETVLLPKATDAPDHIAVELEYLSHLSRLEGEAWHDDQMLEAKKWRIKERTFLVHHLRNWGPSFFEKMERTAELDAYKAIASIGRIFMILEYGK